MAQTELPAPAASTAEGSDRAPSDRELVERFVARRDEDAFRALYRRHSPALYRFAIRLVGTGGDPEELLQETWIRAAPLLARFRWESALATWLFGVAIHRWRELGRSGRRRASALARADAAAEVRTTEEGGGRAEAALDLDTAIRTLPDGYREVLLLHDLHGYTHEEIGRLLDIDAGTSKSQLFRARRAVRLRLAPRAGDSGENP
jgi:RNA polymerase sigma-70 factor (ECF subfamily)